MQKNKITQLLGVRSLRVYFRDLKELDMLFYFMPRAAPPVVILDHNFSEDSPLYLTSLALIRIYMDAQLRTHPLPENNLELRLLDGQVVKSEIALDEQGQEELKLFNQKLFAN